MDAAVTQACGGGGWRRVTIAPSGVTVRGFPLSNTKVFDTDSKGEGITSGSCPATTVFRRTVFVLSAFHERSWDSRYFGFVPTTAILSTMEPVWTW